MPIPQKYERSKLKENLFITEYINCHFNGAEAVRRVYNIGGKGGSCDPRASTARTMAAKLLAKGSVRAEIMQRLEDADMGMEFVLKHLKRIVESRDFDASLAAIDRIAVFLGIELHPPKTGRTRTQEQPIVHLGLPPKT